MNSVTQSLAPRFVFVYKEGRVCQKRDGNERGNFWESLCRGMYCVFAGVAKRDRPELTNEFYSSARTLMFSVTAIKLNWQY